LAVCGVVYESIHGGRKEMTDEGKAKKGDRNGRKKKEERKTQRQPEILTCNRPYEGDNYQAQRRKNQQTGRGRKIKEGSKGNQTRLKKKMNLSTDSWSFLGEKKTFSSLGVLLPKKRSSKY
jgi:hypothetical protein